jgi:G:T/U-mismatch repair DNA glycosylase
VRHAKTATKKINNHKQIKMTSKHPFEAFVPTNSERLIIGTIPPPRFCKEPYTLYDNDVNFYYGSQDNSFWNIIESVFNIELEYTNTEKAIKQRQDFLNKFKIGITDIIDTCVHFNDSAKDEDLKEIKHKNLKSVLEKNSSIKTLIYTSEFVKKQVNEHFRTYHSIDKQDKKKQSITINGKVYQVRILYSPSGMALINMGKNGEQKRKEQYREYLTKD